MSKDTYKKKFEEHSETFYAYFNLGMAYKQMGKEISESYKYLNKALQVAGKVYGKNSLESAKAYFEIGQLYKISGDLYNANNHFKVVKEILLNKAEGKKLLDNIRKELGVKKCK